MKHFYNYLIHFGVKPSHNNHYNKKIKLLNFVCILWYFAFIFTSILTVVVRDNYEVLLSINIFGFLFVLATHIMNKKGKFIIAAFVLLIYTTFYFLLITSFVVTERFVEFFLILVPCCGLLCFEKQKYYWFFLGTSLIAFHIPFYVFDYYKSETIMFISPLMIFLFLLVFLIVLYFKKLNSSNEVLLAQERDKALKDKIILEKQEIKLRELNEFKSHFFVNLSHEIRTPLTLIQGYANQIDLKESEEVNTGKLEIVKAQCKQMQDIINNIMDLSKIESSELQITPTHINLQSFLVKHFADFKGVFIKKNIDFQLNNQAKNTTVLIDQDLFSKAINNLLSNALKFTSTGGVVSINASFVNNQLILEIKDNGIGIPEDEIELVYNRFYQVKNDITKSQGSGIGLAFTKSIVDAHNFSIELTSVYTKTTSFKIWIPMEYTKSYDPTLSEKELTLSKTIDTLLPSKNVISKGKQKILLVDDHEPMRLYLKEVLKNYSITQAENGKEALEILKENHSFDLIITDYMMPVMDGEELVIQLKQKQHKTPIIVLTARTDNHGKLSMLRLGIDGYLHKPFMEEELLINVRNSLKLYENIKEFDKNNSVAEVKELNTHTDKFNTKISTYINENMASHLLTVDTVADYMNVSRSTLNRKTKSILGLTVNQLIVEVRLAKARDLKLEDPLASKKEIAQAVGVSNTTHLFNSLKERYGI